MDCTRKIGALLITAALFGLSGPVWAGDQPATRPDRPKIGLALSGGGARGIAHVGVLKELERLEIPIDYIAGTSMGAIVGGLYAAGMSVEDLETAMLDTDWAARFQDAPSRKFLSFRRKQDNAAFLIEFELGFANGKFKLPKGLIQGQQSRMLLNRLTLPAWDVGDFDDLPIPFRAVATDLERGDPVILDSGNLAAALAASMAIPAVFAPVEIEGLLLVDGGLTDNIPIDVVREMGADVIIAVDVAASLKTREELTSAVDVTNQTIDIMIGREMRRQLATLTSKDVVITPDLGEVSALDFELASTLIPLGSAAALGVGAELVRLSVQPPVYAEYLADLRELPQEPPVIEFIQVVNHSHLASEIIESRIETPVGEPLNISLLEDDINRIYGMGYFELVEYQLIEDNGRTGVRVIATAKSWGPTYLLFGVELADDFEGGTSFNLSTRITRTELNTRGAEWRTDLQLGTEPLLFTEFYQPLDYAQRYFFAPSIELERFNLDVFDQGMRIAEVRLNTARAGMDFGRHFGNWGELRIGLERISGRISTRTGDPMLMDNDIDDGAIVTQFIYDTINNPSFPRQGTTAEVAWIGSRDALGADVTANSFEAATLSAITPGGKNTVLVVSEFATTLDDEGGLAQLRSLGGFGRLSGFNQGELVGQHLGFLGLVYYRRFRESGTFNLPLYIGASLEAGNTWATNNEIALNTTLLGGSLWVGADTFLGPMYLAFGIAEGGNTAGYFFLGRPFGRVNNGR